MVQVVPGLAGRTGGTAFHVVDSARALQMEGVDVSVVATDLPATAGRASRRSVTQDELPPGWQELRELRLCRAVPPRRMAFSPELGRAVAHEVATANVVHIHSLFLYPQYAAYRAATRGRVPYIVSPHGAIDPFLRARGRLRKRVVDAVWQQRMLEGAAVVHFMTTEEARLAADVRLGTRQVVVPTGIWTDQFAQLPDPSAFRERYGLDGLVVLFLGRLSFKKGLDVLVEAFARAALPDAQLVIAGPDDEGLQPSLAAAARSAGVGDRVTFTGMLHGVERLEALAATDVWALPSYTENFGIAVVEALAAGRPVLISPAVNVASELEAAGAASVAPAEAAAFGAALRSLATDPARRAAFGESARRFAQRYDWREVVTQFVALYDGVRRRGRLD